MPELPEVEAYRRRVAARGLGRRVERVGVAAPRMLAAISPKGLSRALVGRSFRRALRHGKWLLVEADGAALALHFGMSGDLVAGGRGEEPPKHTRLLLTFADGTWVALDDPRMFGRVGLAPSAAAFVRARRLGPDALGIALGAFRSALRDLRGGLKAALLDQAVVAGLGNLYVDEALHRARLSPRARVPDLSDAELRRLHAAIRSVLRTAVERRAEFAEYPPRWLLFRRDARDAPCPRCGRRLSKATVAGRTTVWCPRCQPAP